MILKTINLWNYRKYQDAFVEFPDGIVGIIGLNGVGKSTLIEAIGWVLFGHRAARTTKELIKREGAYPNESCGVALQFELENASYKVVREMVGKNLVPRSSLIIDGKLITNNADKATEFIQAKIGMDYQSFFTSVFARQKELNALSTMKAAERKKLVLRMLGIERVDDTIQSIRRDMRDKEKKIEGIKAATVDKEGRMKADEYKRKKEESEKERVALFPIIKEVEKGKYLKEKEVAKAKNKLEVSTKKYEEYVELGNKLGEKKKDLENTGKRKKEKEIELEDLNAKMEQLGRIEVKEAEYFEWRKKKEDMEQIREKYRRKKELMKREEKTIQVIKERIGRTKGLKDKIGRFDGVEEIKGEVTRRIDDITRDKERLNTELGTLKANVMQLQKEIKEIKEKKEKIEDLGCDGECPLCERKLESHYQVLVEKLSTEIGEKKGAHWDIVQEYKNKKKELEAKETKEAKEKKKNKELERLVMEKKEINTRIAHEIREIEEWKKELSRLKTEIAPIRCVEFDEAHYKEAVKTITHLEGVYEKIIVLRAEIARTEEVKKNLAGLTKLEKRMVEEIKEVERQIESLAFDKAEYEQTKERYEKEKEELNEVRMDLLRKRNEWENVCRDIERMEEEIKEQERLLEEKEKEERDIIYLGLLEKIMNQFKVYMVGMIRPMLSEYASDMLIRLTDGKYSKMELDENYDVFIYDEGTSYEINRFSGGEEDLANLCLRLAISAVVVERSAIQTNFVILDEIFGSQDAIRKRNIITALNELSKKFRQIFLITHIEEVKDYMEYVLRVTEDEEGVSRVRMGE